MPNKVLCVLGMHRSGTSCLAGTLEEAGVFLGDVDRHGRHNARGNRENRRIMALHDELLAANGGSWDDPPEQVRWAPEHKDRQRKIICSYAGRPVWGFKDPRTLFTLEGWLEEIPQLTLLGIFRHPLAVAVSLRRRDRFPLERGVRLWEVYNRRLLACHARHRFPLLRFDAGESELPRQLADVLGRLGLPVAADRLKFFDPGLRHAPRTRAALCRQLVAAKDLLDGLKGAGPGVLRRQLAEVLRLLELAAEAGRLTDASAWMLYRRLRQAA